MIQKVLAIETSCDDTSVAVVDHKAYVHSLVSASQDLEHEPYGGIVPEIACRNHTLALIPLIERALSEAKISWSEIQALAVTNRPGLIGALIVGLVTAKTLAQIKSLPFLGVNHLEGHLLAPFLQDSQYQPQWELHQSSITLAISGGHTSLYLVRGLGDYEIIGSTRDDAAGEAFDKFAKMVGLGFPGGVRVDQEARLGKTDFHSFPRSLLNETHFDMSFSGLKSAAQRLVEEWGEEKIRQHRADLCASYQEAVVDVLLHKMDQAVQKHKISRVILTGGVSANSRLRQRAVELAKMKNWQLMIPPLRYCTDNAAMIGLVGILRMNRGEFSDLNLGPSPQAWPQDFKDRRPS